MNWRLALITFAVLPLIVYATTHLPRQSAGFLPPHSHRHRPHQLIPAGARQRHGGAAAIQPREAAYENFPKSTPSTWTRSKTRSWRTPFITRWSKFCPSIAIACVIWFGGRRRRCNPASACSRPRRPGRLHPVRAALLPADPGPQREVQHPAIRHGVQRTRLQTAGHAGRNHQPAVTKTPDGPGRIEFDHVWFAYRTSPAAKSGTGPDGRQLDSRSARLADARVEPTGFCAMCPSPSNRARPSRSSATPAPARPPSSRC